MNRTKVLPSIIVITLILFLLFFKKFSANESFKDTIYSCIHNSSKKLKLKFTTDNLVNFEVFLVSNTPHNCVNPHFPSIHIKNDAAHNAWLHIVYTDSKTKSLQKFIDSEHPLKEKSIHPFYIFEQDFYDAPLWTYSFFSKPLSFWKGQAFALEVNHQDKTVRWVGGIEWGFKLYFPKMKPVAINPRLLNQIDWETAWQLMKEQLPGYRLLDSSL